MYWMPDHFANSVLTILAALALSVVLFHPRVVASKNWRATVTPLASIIGSGFLVVGPILLRHFGDRAVFIMAGLCLLSYAIGGAVRFNIRAFGDAAESTLDGVQEKLETASSWALSFAYVVSVCYYLNLFGAFAVSLTDLNDAMHGRLVTTAVLVFIGALGWTRGLRGLERAEELSVAVKLSVIAGLLVGMTYYAIELAIDGGMPRNGLHVESNSLRVAMGLLITVQGFETSRYLSEEYDAGTRVRTMRWAQWIATAIYISYTGLASMEFTATSFGARETAIIQMTQQVAPVLPMLLVVAALAAQFSAAVADTNGCGGLAREVSSGRISSRSAYVMLSVFGIALTWSADVYRIIGYASRVFAVYYALQCAQAAALSRLQAGFSPRTLGFALLAIFAASIAVFGISPE